MTQQLGKYLKVHSRNGMHIMFNDDHLLVPVVDIVQAYRYTQGNVTCVSNNVAGVGLQFLANQANQMEVIIRNSKSVC
jgi:hypothetical protein